MGSSSDQFEAYFKRADLDGDGQISGAEAVAFFQASGLPKNVLAQVWTHADQRKAGYLGRQEFYNALKLVTVAQSKLDLSPEMVKSALYGPASSKIPAPQINLAATPTPRAATSSPQSGGTMLAAPQNAGIRPLQILGNASANQQNYPLQQNQLTRPPQAVPSGPAPNPHQVLANQGTPRGTATAAPPQNTNISTDWFGGGTLLPTSQIQTRGMTPPVTQDGFGVAVSGSTPTIQPRPSVTAGQMPSTALKPQDSAVASNQQAPKDSKPAVASGNGFASDSLFGDVFYAAPTQPRGGSPSPTSAVSSLPASSAIVPSSAGSQPSSRPSSAYSLEGTFSQQPASGLSTGSENRQFPTQNTSSLPSTGYPTGAGNLATNQSQRPWPKMTHSDVQKYMKVFVQVDTDRDGKITGEEARNLFLSWRLPREVLKQVWDLSDQDNDSMLSLKEFCVALYLMERYREGRPLPTTLPSTISSDEILLSATSHLTASFGGGSFGLASVGKQFSVGVQQPQVMAGTRPTPAAAPKPPRPSTAHHADDRQPSQRKPKIPVLDKHLVDQLSEEEQSPLNSKFQEASQADKKVEELEKEISDSRQKIEFFRFKMQELILYKSRCDNRLNEVSARVSSDKHEVEALAKKYEEKYKQAGDVASRLTIEEATFRDIQEKKMELYRAIVKMEEGGTVDGVLKERVDHVQSGLEELVRTLNERCKQYGLRAKPTSLIELPFGWQPGIQGGAADWDKDWDKFEDEGFTFVKELTLDVQNVVAPPKTKSSSVRKDTTPVDRDLSSSPNSEMNSEKDPSSKKQVSAKESANDNSENGVARSHPDSPTGRKSLESQPCEFQDSPFREAIAGDESPHDKDIQSDAGGAESVLSGGKGVFERGWGTFDTHYDTESVWGFDSVSGKEMDHDKHSESSMLDIGEFGLNPIKTGSRADSMFQSKGPFAFADSVLGTPAYDQGRGIFADSVPSTPAYNQGKSIFADSVPSTPAYNLGKGQFPFADSVPSTPAYSQGKSPFTFADSVPSTPAYNNSPRRLSEGTEGHFFDSFSRFDSFNTHNSGFFQSSGHSLSRFDSMHSTGESDQSYGFPSRFDSFREPVHSDQNSGFSRFDSFRDTDQSHGFSRFDSIRDSDHNSAFPSSFDSFGESRNFDHGHGFSKFDSLSTHDRGLSQSSGNSVARFDSGRGSRDFDYSHGFPSFDDADPFGSGGPFKSSMESETPRKTSDSWGF